MSAPLARFPIPILLLTMCLLLAACVAPPAVGSLLNPTPTMTPEVHETAPLPTVPTTPVITLSPNRGGPRTRITVTGRGFPGGTRLVIHLGPTAELAANASYGEAIADATGSFTASLILPSEWPTGTPVVEERLVVLASNTDSSANATATLSYEPDTSMLSPIGTQEQATETPTNEPRLAEARRVVEAFLAAFQKDPAGKGTLIYLTPALQGKAQKGPGIAALLAVPGGYYSSSEVTSVEPGDDENTIVVRADLYVEPPVTRVFLLTESGGVWKIADIAQE